MFCGVSLLLVMICLILLEIRGAPVRQSSEDFVSTSPPYDSLKMFDLSFMVGITEDPPAPGGVAADDSINFQNVNFQVFMTEEPLSTEGNKIKAYRSKKTANRTQKHRNNFIESNTFAKSKRKVGSFSEGRDENEKR